jgi:hypothetical protein
MPLSYIGWEKIACILPEYVTAILFPDYDYRESCFSYSFSESERDLIHEWNPALRFALQWRANLRTGFHLSSKLTL